MSTLHTVPGEGEEESESEMYTALTASQAERECGRLLRQPPSTLQCSLDRASLPRSNGGVGPLEETPLPVKKRQVRSRPLDALDPSSPRRQNLKRPRSLGDTPASGPATVPCLPLTVTLRSLSLSFGAQHDLFDILVLVLQASGLQSISTKSGHEFDVQNLLVADPSASFVKLTLWGQAARYGARLVRPGDLVRFNRVRTSKYQGTIQGNSTIETSFRIVWRDDAFMPPEDFTSTIMRTQAHCPGSEQSLKETDLSIDRSTACEIAAWAKREFPSVTSHTRGQFLSVGVSVQAWGSLAGAQQGVETNVLVCVLCVSQAERLWVWKSAKGMHRKDLISRATALVTDGSSREMTLQLWDSLAGEDTLSLLRNGILPTPVSSGSGGTEKAVIKRRWAVFEISNVRPEYSFLGEALVLNTTLRSTVSRLPNDSLRGAPIIAAVACVPPVIAKGTATSVITSASAFDRTEFGVGIAVKRAFPSVSDLLDNADFCGIAVLMGVVVYGVEAPKPLVWWGNETRSVASTAVRGATSNGGSGASFHLFHIRLGDRIESAKAFEVGKGVGELRVSITSGVAEDLLGGIPPELLLHPVFVNNKLGDIASSAAALVEGLLGGLVEGGVEGKERFDVILRCSAAVDDNGWVMTGGNRYEVVRWLGPSRRASKRGE
ncbi:unnamed protein product [Choristocarpus tenellus]